MTVNYTSLLSLGQPVTGTESGTWGDDVNNAVTSYLDIAIAGTLTLTGDGAVTLANTQGTNTATNISSTTAQYAILKVVGPLTATKVITAPSISKTYLVINTDSTYGVTIKASGQSGVTIAAGARGFVAFNGTDYVVVSGSNVSNLNGLGTGVATALGVNVGSSGAFVVNGGALGTPSSGTLTNTTGLPVSTGISGLGTGVATALAVNTGTAGAFVVNGGALGTPSSGTLTNTTGLPLSTGVTGTLGVSNGGTGLTTTPTDGQIDIGNGSGFTRTTLTAGSGISITNGAGSVTIEATSGGGGTVTSVGVSGGTTGLTTSGSPITTSGTITLAGTLAVANGGTGQTTFTNGQLLIGNTTGNTLTKSTLTAGSGISITNGTGSITIAATGGSGTVTSVAVSGGSTGLTTSGGPITTSGTITIAGTLAVTNGGTGATTAANARTNLGLGTIATQNSNSVSITGGAIGNTTIGASNDASSGAFTTLSASDGLTLSGTAKRFKADFSNATVASRLIFQTSTTNSATGVFFIPAGTGAQADLVVCSNSDVANSSYTLISCNATTSVLEASKLGTGTLLPLAINVGGAERMRVATDGSITMPDVYGDTVGATNRDLYIDDTGKLGYVSSVRESKTNINELGNISWLYQLTPVSYQYRKKDAQGEYTDEADGTIDYGLIAEDVEAIKQELCFYDVVEDGQTLRGVTYSKLITPMLKAIQDLKSEVDLLKAEIGVLKGN